MTEVVWIFEFIGVAAFAMSGVLVGIEYGFDYVGIVFLAIISSVGGGFIRDISLGVIPPSSLVKPHYIIVALVTAVLGIIVRQLYSKRTVSLKKQNLLRKTIAFSDAIGLGLFAVSSAQLTMDLYPDGNIFLVVFVAVITSIGGGVMRDLLANRKPVVMRAEIYALAAVAGGIVYFALTKYAEFSRNTVFFICVTLTVAIRVFSMWKHLKVPTFQNDNKAQE